MSNYIIAFIIISIFILAIIKKVNLYDSFSEGVKNTLKVIVNLFIYVFTFNYALKLLNSSGLISDIIDLFKINLNSNLLLELIIRPFSSSSSLAMLVRIYNTCGKNNFESISATLIHSSIDAVFYVIGLYESLLKLNKSGVIKHAIILYIIACLLSILFALILFTKIN